MVPVGFYPGHWLVFSSFEFLIFFLPIVVAGYFLASKFSHRTGLLWLTVSSILFYGWWNPVYLPLLLGSILFNYYIGQIIRQNLSTRRAFARAATILGISFNISFLCFFKYADFLIENTNALFRSDIHALNIVLPLGISFFTFQKIAYLADCWSGKVKDYDFMKFSLFVMFFPQLIAGPIVHHSEMIPQFSDKTISRVNWNNIAAGLFVIAAGLFKKVVVADHLAAYASWGFDAAPILSFSEAWITVFCYTFQIYFDFSGYTDMAIGAALMLNIKLPVNFNSPYKAFDIRDFWRRWHITLSRFLRDYLYIPLGGNRSGVWVQSFAIITTFLIGGLWHGASWMFVLWGALHAGAIILNVLWGRLNIALPKALGWVLTFTFINLSWVMFRARDWESAKKVYSALIDIRNVSTFPDTIYTQMPLLCMAIMLMIVFCVRVENTQQILGRFRATPYWWALTALIGIAGLFCIGNYSEFLYFQF